MQHKGYLRVFILVVGVCGIAAGHFSPFYESSPARGSVINIDTHTALYPTATISSFHMPGYDHYFAECMPEAIRMRQGGSTPQEICTTLAYDIFEDRLVDLPWHCLRK